jgi:hypothetical protein
VADDETRQAFQVQYVGENPEDHTMDVEELGPALIGFGKMIRAANEEFNQDKARVRVLVASDFEHRCFQINFEVVQILKDITDFLQSHHVELTELLKRLGIIVTGTAGIVGSVFGYLKWKRGRKVDSVIEVKDSPGTIVLKVEGDNNVIQISKDVFQLAQNREVLDAVEEALAPLRTGRDKAIKFGTDEVRMVEYRQHDVEDIIASCEDGGPIVIDRERPEKTRTVTGTLYSYGPVFDTKAPNWRFLYRNKPIYADVRGTSIARDAIARGGSFLNDRYRVRMEVAPPTAPDGTPHYKIIEVLEFSQAEQQITMELKKPRGRPRGGSRRR